jgi:hypothetical protein
MKLLKLKRWIVIGVVISPLLSGAGGRSQEQPLSNHREMSSSKVAPENSWRMIPFDVVSSPDDVAPAIRQARTAHWMPILRQHSDSAKHGLIIGEPIPFRDENAPEIPTNDGGIWVVAKFDSYIVVPVDLSSGHDSSDVWNYTEMSFYVRQVLYAPPAADAPLEGRDFDVDEYGGVARLYSGQVVSHPPRPSRYSLQPGRIYIMEIIPASSGSFYHVQKYWDVTEGRVKPESNVSELKSVKGVSELVGKTLSDAVALITHTLSSGEFR